MNREINRLDRLEDGLRKTQDSILIMSKDIHSMNDSIKSIAESMKTLVEVKQEIALINERSETRNNQHKDSIKLLHSRIDSLVKKDENVKEKAEKGERAYTILVQIAKWLGGSAATILMGLLVYLIQLKG